MKEVFTTPHDPENRKKRVAAYIAGIQAPGTAGKDAGYLLDELTRLVDTLGLEIAAREIIPLRQLSAAYLVGSGKAEEIAARARESGADCIVFDEELSPSQQRNWERLSGLGVIDRHEVILQIFADRATTREAIMQVQLAQLEYSLPRLKRAWTHLSRQRGGARGTRGEGEAQIEMDRRMALNRIHKIKIELDKVRNHRDTQRKRRNILPMPAATIIGYTNAGKSSLLNTLTGSRVTQEDKLFATLDPTTRRLLLPCGKALLLTDTVGFIRKLPHDLIEAFKSTLEETRYSDFLIHLIDASSTEVPAHMESTQGVLREIGIENKPTLNVFNKIDLVREKSELDMLRILHPEGVFISARTGEGMEILLKKMDAVVRTRFTVAEFIIPAKRHDLVSAIHRDGVVLEEKYVDSVVQIRAEVPERVRSSLSAFIIS